MILPWHTTSKKLLGLDIGSTHVKLLELTRLNHTFQVDGYAVAPLPNHAVSDKEIKDKSAVAAAINDALTRLHSNTKAVITALADAVIITRTICIDKALNPQDMASQVAVEAKKYIAYPIDELSLDFEVLGIHPQQPEFVDVLLVACHAKHIESRVAVVSASGLTPVIMDVESYALARAVQALILPQLPLDQPKQTIAIVDITAIEITVTIVSGDTPLFTRAESFSDSEVLQPSPETLVLHLQRALQFFYATEQHKAINTLILSGSLAKMPDLADVLTEQFKINTCIANPFAKMTFAPAINAEALLEEAPNLLLCCGLAMRPHSSWHRKLGKIA